MPLFRAFFVWEGSLSGLTSKLSKSTCSFLTKILLEWAKYMGKEQRGDAACLFLFQHHSSKVMLMCWCSSRHFSGVCYSAFCLHFTWAKPGSWEEMKVTFFVKTNSPIDGIWGKWLAVLLSSDSECEEFQQGKKYKVKIKKQKERSKHFPTFLFPNRTLALFLLK